MTKQKGQFWQDLEQDFQDPEFASQFLIEKLKVEILDEMINALDSRRIEIGSSKAELARRLRAKPSSIRRFFSKPKANPTIETVIEVALSVGYQLKFEELSSSRKKLLTQSKSI